MKLMNIVLFSYCMELLCVAKKPAPKIPTNMVVCEFEEMYLK